jgi:hypothetical protein
MTYNILLKIKFRVERVSYGSNRATGPLSSESGQCDQLLGFRFRVGRCELDCGGDMLRVDSGEQGERSGRCSGDQHATEQGVQAGSLAPLSRWGRHVGTALFRRGTPCDLRFKHTMLWCFETY